jgi:hypothetical protein
MDSIQVQTFYAAGHAGAIGQSQDKAAQRQENGSECQGPHQSEQAFTGPQGKPCSDHCGHSANEQSNKRSQTGANNSAHIDLLTFPSRLHSGITPERAKRDSVTNED